MAAAEAAVIHLSGICAALQAADIQRQEAAA